MKIHHATAKKAENNDVEFKETPKGIVAIHSSGKKVVAPTAPIALEKVLKLVKGNNDEDEDGESGDGEEEAGVIIVKDKYKKKYLPNGGNCGDKLAKALTTWRADQPSAWERVCKENKIEINRWTGKNKGLQWMALSNVLRNRIRHKEEVTIGGKAITSL